MHRKIMRLCLVKHLLSCIKLSIKSAKTGDSSIIGSDEEEIGDLGAEADGRLTCSVLTQSHTQSRVNDADAAEVDAG